MGPAGHCSYKQYDQKDDKQCAHRHSCCSFRRIDCVGPISAGGSAWVMGSLTMWPPSYSEVKLSLRLKLSCIDHEPDFNGRSPKMAQLKKDRRTSLELTFLARENT